MKTIFIGYLLLAITLLYHQLFSVQQTKLFAVSNIESVFSSRQTNTNTLSLYVEEIESQFDLIGNQDIDISYNIKQYLWRLNPQALTKGEYEYDYFLQDWFSDKEALLYDQVNPNNLFDINNIIFNQNIILAFSGLIGREIRFEISYNQEESKNQFFVEYRPEKIPWLQSIYFGNVTLPHIDNKNFSLQTNNSGIGLSIELLTDKSANNTQSNHQNKNHTIRYKSTLATHYALNEMENFTLRENTTKIIKDIDYIPRIFYQLPHEKSHINIRSVVFYEEITDREFFHLADLTVDYEIESESNFIYLQRVSPTEYSLNYQDGVFQDLRSSKNQKKYSFVFYSYEEKQGIFPPLDSNLSFFLGDNIDFHESNPNLNFTESKSNVVILTVPTHQYDDENLKHLYELKNRYNIPKNTLFENLRIQVFDHYNIGIASENTWKDANSHHFNHLGKAYFDLTEGLLIFEKEKPFSHLPNQYKGFYEKSYFDERENGASLHLQYQETKQNQFTLKHRNVIKDSIKVYVNDALLSKKKYSIKHNTITFKPPPSGVILLTSDVITVKYKYLHSDNLYNQDYYWLNEVNFNLFKHSTIRLYSGIQWGLSLPHSPSVLDAPSQFTFSGIEFYLKPFSFLKWHFLDLEIAGNYQLITFKENRYPKAIVDDSTRHSFILNLSLAEKEYYFSANSQLESKGYLLGKSFYRDFSEYSKIDNSKTLLEFTLENENRMRKDTQGNFFSHPKSENIFPFEKKAGPYTLQNEGHLEKRFYPYQDSLVIDYDFSNENNLLSYVSFIAKFSTLKKEVDLNDFSAIEIIYKIIPEDPTLSFNEMSDFFYSLGLSIDVGSLGEDLDLDGVLDREIHANDTEGFPFNYQNGNHFINTHIGGSTLGWNDNQGNGILDSEDRNGNNILNYSIEEIFSYPSSYRIFFYEETEENNSSKLYPLYSALSFHQEGDVTYEVLSNYSANHDDPYQRQPYIKMTVDLKSIRHPTLQNPEHVRLNFIQMEKKLTKGKVILNRIGFVANHWQTGNIDDHQIENPTQIKISTLSELDSESLGQNKLSKNFEEDYEDLYGKEIQNDQERIIRPSTEEVTKMEYSLNGIQATNTNDYYNGKFALLEKNSSESDEVINLINYKKFHFYLYDKMFLNTSEDFVYRFGNNQNQYYELRLNLYSLFNENTLTSSSLSNPKWHKITIHFDSNSLEEDIKKSLDDEHLFYVEVTTKDKSFLLSFEDYSLTKINRAYLNDISYFAFGIAMNKMESSTGELWIDEFHVEESKLNFILKEEISYTFKQNKQTPFLDKLKIQNGLMLLNNKSEYSDVLYGSRVPYYDKAMNLKMSFDFFDFLQYQYQQNKNYRYHKINEALLPKSKNKLFTFHKDFFSLKLSDIKWLPELYHSYSKSQSRNIDFQDYFNENDFELQQEQKENNIKEFFISEKKEFKITRDLTFMQSYSFQNKSQKDFNTTLPIKSDDELKIHEEHIFDNLLLFNDLDSEEQFPILSSYSNNDFQNTPDIYQRNIRNSYFYKHHFFFQISWKNFVNENQFVFSKEEYAIATNQQDYRDYFADTLEKEYDYFYWKSFLLGLNSLPEYLETLNQRKVYEWKLKYKKRLHLFWFKIASPQLKTHLQYTENNFFNTESSLDVDKFLEWNYHQNNNLIDGLTNHLQSLDSFYRQSHRYKSTINQFHTGYSFEIFPKLFFLKNVPVQIQKKYFLKENNILADKPYIVTKEDKELWQENPANLRYGVETNYINPFDYHEREEGAYLNNILAPINLLPYVDLPLLSMIVKQIYSLFSEKNEYYNASSFYRRWISKEIDNTVNYKQYLNDTVVIHNLSAHENYSAAVKHEDSFNINLYFLTLKKGWVLLPSDVSYKSTLLTQKEEVTIKQEGIKKIHLHWDIRKKIKKILSKSKPTKRVQFFKRIKKLNLSTSFKKKEDYYQKLIDNNYEIYFDGKYSFLSSKYFLHCSYQYKYNQVQSHLYLMDQYLGIGEFLENEKNYNIGKLETTFFERKEELSKLYSYDTYRHEIILSWLRREYLVNKIFVFFPFKGTAKQSFNLKFQTYHFTLPDIDTTLFEEGHLLPEQQESSEGKNALRNSLNNLPYNLGNQIKEYSLILNFQKIIDISKHFKIKWHLSFIFDSILKAPSYIAYQYRNIAQKQKDTFSELSLSEKEYWLENYFLEDAYLLLNFDFGLGVKVAF